MGIKIKLIIQATVIAALLSLIGSVLFHHVWEGVAIFAGALWGSVNLFFLKLLMQSLLLQRAKNRLKLALLVCIKCPLLYLAGYGLLKTKYLPPLYLLVGFSIIFANVVILGLCEVLKKHA
jgi:hypothetical protein